MPDRRQRDHLGALIGGAALALVPVPRPLRYRLRLRFPAAAPRADALADRAILVILVAAVACAVLAAGPHRWLPAGVDRFWLVGAGLGFALGIPFALDRRVLRRRLRDLPPLEIPAPPLAVAGDPHAPAAAALAAGDPAEAALLLAPAVAADPPDVDALRLAALAAVAIGDWRVARACALRAVKVDPGRWQVLVEIGTALCRGGRFSDGVRMLEQAVQSSRGSPSAQFALAQGLATAGRLREAVAILDRVERRR